MKRAFLAALIILSMAGLSAELVDKIVAKVGTDIILLSDLQKQLAQMQQAKVLTPDTDPQDVLNEMVEQKLMLQKARDLNVKVDDARIKSMAERYLKQVKSRYDTEAAFTADLKKSKLTESDLLKYYVDMLTESALTEQLVDKYISTKIKVSEPEMQAFYTATKDSLAIKPVSWKLGMIMREIKPGKDAQAEKLAQLKEIQQRLKNGEDFAALASTESDCPSKEVGGDLGFFKRGMMVKPFEDAAFALQPGEISDIVESQFGYHIIKLEEVKGDEIRARHILKMVAATSADTLNEHKLMEDIRSRFAKGESFASLAAQYSMDPESAAEGGSLGEFGEKDFPELFATQIMQTPVGQLTPVLENEGLLYLFIRSEEMPSRTYSYDEVKDQVQKMLFRRKQMEAYSKWISELKRESYVQITL
jgi:peptidyl-prolyl cis-trans isomerase SurA